MYPEEDRPRSQMISSLSTLTLFPLKAVSKPPGLYFDPISHPHLTFLLTTFLSSSFLPFLHIPLPTGSSTAQSFISRHNLKWLFQACLQHVMLLCISRVTRTVLIFPSSEWRLVRRPLQGEDWHFPICIRSTAQHWTPREVILEELEVVERN